MQLTGLPIDTVTWIAALAAVLITVLYILKLRKKSVEIPFSPLWSQVMTTKSRRTDWWRRLKRLFSWFLHLLIAALLAAAMLGPHFDDEVIDERHVLILVDNSASMNATDVTGGHDRFDVARSKAREVLETIGGDDRVMVVMFNNRVQPLGPFVDDSSLIDAALREQRATANPTDLEQALSFAADSLRDRQPAELIIITDGASITDDTAFDIDLGEHTRVRHLKVGESSENLAITAFNARRYPSNRLDHEVFVEVRSFYDRPVEASLELRGNDRLIDTQPLSLEPGEIHRQFYPGQAVSGERLEARVRLVTEDARNVFPLDNRAYATVPPPQRLSVQLVSRGNLYVEGSLILNNHLDIEHVHPDDYDPNAEFDVTIFDGVGFEAPASGHLLYIDPPEEFSPFPISSRDDEPIITDVRSDHPLLRWVTLRDLNISSSKTFTLEAGDDPVASSFGQPIIAARDREGRRTVAIGFDVRNSDFPLRVAFPVFLLNVIDYFADDDTELMRTFPTGETWSIPVDYGIDSAQVVTPDGARLPAAVHHGAALFYGETPGFYELITDQGTTVVAANLADPQESDIQPRSIELADADVADDISDLLFDRRQLWILLLAIALVLLFVEWLTYNRRWTV